MQGPHDSDDFMTLEDRDMMYSTAWGIGHNSNRTGVRLSGPTPKWSRADGGDGGSHPSNVFDYAYPTPGGINWTGDSPFVFTMDSPNLGGLLCSSTVISGDLWRLGQTKSGDTIKFTPTTYENAVLLTARVEAFVEDLQKWVNDSTRPLPTSLNTNLPSDFTGAILKIVDGDGATRPKVVYRQVSLLPNFTGQSSLIVLGWRYIHSR